MTFCSQLGADTRTEGQKSSGVCAPKALIQIAGSLTPLKTSFQEYISELWKASSRKKIKTIYDFRDCQTSRGVERQSPADVCRHWLLSYGGA